ncbi:MAG: 40S ribosomal protein S3 [Candelaria pacifica]|nr:MAG: 40S ribosomal protein S3 [Candelaria pacifica]
MAAVAQGSAISKRRKFVAGKVYSWFTVPRFDVQMDIESPDSSPVFHKVNRSGILGCFLGLCIHGVFYAELNEFFQRELAEEGYSGVEVRVTPTVTDIIIRATHTQEVLGEQGRRIRELTSLIQKRFKFPENSVSLYAAKVQNRGLSAVAQCESLRYKLLNGLAVRRACYGVLRFIMESGAKGCEVVVSGKLRAARAKSMKFTDGFMIHSGQPAKDFIDSATRHVLLRQGVLGIKVKIMRGSDPEGKSGPQKSLPDSVTIIEPKEEQSVVQPMSQDYGAKAVAAQQAAEQQRQSEQQEQQGGEDGEGYAEAAAE